MAPLKIAVLASGSGTNLQAILDEIAAGRLAAQVTLVVASRPNILSIKRAQTADVPVLVMSKEDYGNPEAADRKIVEAAQASGAEYIIMAGYMRKVTPVMLGAYPHRVVNLHPALLPSFPGAHGIADAFDYGVKVTGITVHFANEDYDRGPIIAQVPVVIEEDDTLESLEAKIHAVEHKLYPQVVGWLAARRVVVTDGGKVKILEEGAHETRGA